ncbi:MAG: nucleoside deaminase [Candidatus Eremiobacteraeota bacterium]|nr:nucleoside deaminase [Candidatus Eremiobacteraeota bacterium]
MTDEEGVRRAIALAERAERAGEVPVGAVWSNGSVLVEAQNEKERRTDPTAHAETLALREAGSRLGSWRTGGTLYVSKEPCAMCAGAMVAARLERLVYGCSDPKAGAAGSVIDVFASEAVNHRVEVVGGVLAQETGEQLRAFFARRRSSASEPPGTESETVL